MVFSCAPNFRAKRQALRQKAAGLGTYTGVSLRLLLVDKQASPDGHLGAAALPSVHVVHYDSAVEAMHEVVTKIREAHRQNTAPFLSIACAQHGPDTANQWVWAEDLTVDLNSMHGAIDQLAPLTEVLSAALSKTAMGKAHVDFLACGLATACKGLVPALEKMYGIDFRASTDSTGNDVNGGDWKMETDNDYDVAADYLDAAKLKAYTSTMCKCRRASCPACSVRDYAEKRNLVAPISAHQPTESELNTALITADKDRTNHGYVGILQKWNLSLAQRIRVWRLLTNRRKKYLAKYQNYGHAPGTFGRIDPAAQHEYQSSVTICKFYTTQHGQVWIKLSHDKIT